MKRKGSGIRERKGKRSSGVAALEVVVVVVLRLFFAPLLAPRVETAEGTEEGLGLTTLGVRAERPRLEEREREDMPWQ